MSTPSQAELGGAASTPPAGSLRTSGGIQQFSLSPGRTARLLGGAALALAVLNLIAQVGHFFSRDFIGRDWLFIMFDANGEANVPSVFSGGLLLLCGLILGVIGLSKRQAGEPFSLHWRVLAAVFLFLALDEVAQVHDNTIVPLRHLMDFGGALYYAWVLPYGALVVVLLLGSFRFLAHLPGATRRLFVLAGTVYVGAALGMELAQGYVHSRFGDTHFMSALSIGLEELMEMLGAVVFIYALLSYIAATMPGFRLQLGVAPDSRS